MMNFFSEMWAIQLQKINFALKYWYVPAILMTIGIVIIYYKNK